MSKKITPTGFRNDIGPLLDEAQALKAATKDVAGQNVQDIRRRLGDTLAAAKEAYKRVHEKAVEGTKNVDEYVREHPFTGIGIGVGIGVLVGLFLARRD